MATKRFKELKNLSKDELATKVREAEAELFQVRMKKVTGQLTDTAQIWRFRKDLARMKMLQAHKSVEVGLKFREGGEVNIMASEKKSVETATPAPAQPTGIRFRRRKDSGRHCRERQDAEDDCGQG